MVVVLCNAPPDRAQALAEALVDERVAACVNLFPGVISVFRWDGARSVEAETTLLIKAPMSGVERLRERIVALHPYQVPEILVLPVDALASHAPYVQWVRDSVPGGST